MESGLSPNLETCLQLRSSRKGSITGLDQNIIWERTTNLNGFLIFNLKPGLIIKFVFPISSLESLITVLPSCT